MIGLRTNDKFYSARLVERINSKDSEIDMNTMCRLPAKKYHNKLINLSSFAFQ